MKTCFLRSIGAIIAFLMGGLITGCSPYQDVGMFIESVEVLSISQERPASVRIRAMGSNTDDCVKSEVTIFYKRRGNIIKVWGYKEIPNSNPFMGGGCADTMVDLYGEVVVENLPIGTYQIAASGGDLLAFRVEADTGYVRRTPIIEQMQVGVKDADPSHVFIQVSGDFGGECQDFLKTEIAQNANTITIDISGEMPINAKCPPYTDLIDLGTFSPGHYEVSVNGQMTWFDM